MNSRKSICYPSKIIRLRRRTSQCEMCSTSCSKSKVPLSKTHSSTFLKKRSTLPTTSATAL